MPAGASANSHPVAYIDAWLDDITVDFVFLNWQFVNNNAISPLGIESRVMPHNELRMDVCDRALFLDVS